MTIPVMLSVKKGNDAVASIRPKPSNPTGLRKFSFTSLRPDRANGCSSNAQTPCRVHATVDPKQNVRDVLSESTHEAICGGVGGTVTYY